MSAIVTTTAAPELMPAFDANLVEFWATYGRAPNYEAHERNDMVKCMTGVPFPLFNGVYYAQLTQDAVAREIAELKTDVHRMQMPSFWWVGPDSKPDDLSNHLKQAGFVPAGSMTNMVVDLNTLDANTPLPPEFSIRIVEDTDTLDTWAHVVAVGSELPPNANEPLRVLEQAVGIRPKHLSRRYIGYVNDVPVATSVLVLHAGIAGMYAVSTLEAYRQRGIGAAMTRLPLLDARAMGYQVGILQATQMGEPVYRRLGFQDIGQINLYLLAPTEG
ncbi:MAG: GNAT family N-acetyltransferase [Chloroflexota bacterium]